MFGKVVFVLAALIATSLGRVTESVTHPVTQSIPLPTEHLPENHKVVHMLNCSSLTGNKIELKDTEFRAIEYPCKLRASEVVLKNNLFWSAESNFEIFAVNVTIEHNGFFGSEQDHRINAYQVDIKDNLYIGQHQIHEIFGPNIMRARNLYDGDFQVHHLTGQNIMDTESIINGKYWSHKNLPMTRIVQNRRKTLSDKLSRPMNKVVQLPLNVFQKANRFGGVQRNTLPSGSGVRHLLNGLKNRGNPQALIVKEIVELYDRALSN
ncbi:hypothetical protein [Cotesia plutellae polydnavirus]|nr:hypothetical protein [Cotesia plutellae polydnavirus]